MKRLSPLAAEREAKELSRLAASQSIEAMVAAVETYKSQLIGLTERHEAVVSALEDSLEFHEHADPKLACPMQNEYFEGDYGDAAEGCYDRRCHNSYCVRESIQRWRKALERAKSQMEPYKPKIMTKILQRRREPMSTNEPAGVGQL
jgi:hypothetical protein